MKNFELRMGREGNLDAGTINRAIALITRPEVPLLNGDLGGRVWWDDRSSAPICYTKQ